MSTVKIGEIKILIVNFINQQINSNFNGNLNSNLNSNIVNKNINLNTLDLKKNNSVLAANYQVDSKISKKLDFSLPVKFKSIQYFRLCDLLKKQLEVAIRELNGNKIDKSLIHAELAYYYLDNIEK